MLTLLGTRALVQLSSQSLVSSEFEGLVCAAVLAGCQLAAAFLQQLQQSQAYALVIGGAAGACVLAVARPAAAELSGVQVGNKYSLADIASAPWMAISAWPGAACSPCCPADDPPSLLQCLQFSAQASLAHHLH